MSNEIEIPIVLIEQQQFCLRINENNFKLFSHVEYLRGLVTNYHQMYNQLCKRIIQITDQYQRKIISTCKVKTAHSEVILQFVKSISLLHFSINSQLNSNSVTLGAKTHRIAKNRVENLKDRLYRCDDIRKQYISEISHFNKEQKALNRQCEYFKDYQKNVIKYYSIKENVELSDKLISKQTNLRYSQQYIFRKKQEYQAQVHQVRAGLKDYYELEKTIISQYSRLLLNIRKVNRQNAEVYAQAILELSNEPSQSHYTTYRDEIMVSKRSERATFEKSVSQIRKQIIREEQKTVLLETCLEQFINQFQESLKMAAERIDELRSSSDYQKFSNDKLAISEILPYQSIREIDLIVNEISLFRTILLNLQTIFGKMKVIKEISKYRISNFDKFVEDTQLFLEEQRKHTLSLDQKQKFHKYQTKFLDRNNQLTSRYRQRVIELQNSILSQYKRQDIAYEDKNKKPFKNDLFEKANYEILMSSFFLNRSQPTPYQENPYLKKIQMHLNANQVQKIITLQGFSKPFKPRKNCCGGLFLWGDDDEKQNFNVIKEYYCALKEGLWLSQGKMRLYENHLGFYSNFNSQTMFGYSDIRIPKWDIYQIILGKYLLSMKITIQTSHGNIEFTNFMTTQDPYQKLIEFYDSKKNVGSIFHKDNPIDCELALLEQRFQSDFRSLLLKVGIIIDTLSTYLSEDKEKLSISIQYHPNGSSCHSMFEIKIMQKVATTDYYFIHDQQSKNNQTKSLIEKVSIKLINMKESELSSNVMKLGQEKELSFSIIEGNQKNKLSFQRQPSFINAKGTQSMGDINFQEMRISHLQIPLLTSRILSGIQTSRNLDLDTRLASENRKTYREENQSGILQAIQQTPHKNQQESMKLTKKSESFSVLKSKKVKEISVSKSHHYVFTNESKKEKISYAKPSSAKSKSINLKKYQGIFYVIIVVFFLNLVLNCIGG